MPLVLAVALAACAHPDYRLANAPPPQDLSSLGSVSAADPRAEEAGTEMLRAGGSATDAAIAVMLALTVVEPQSSGIGGGGFYVRGAADGSVETIDGRETAPAGATPDWFLDEKGKPLPFMEAVRSGLSVGIPGNIALAAEAHAKHGKLPWAQLFEPAIRLAHDGFRMNTRLNESLSEQIDRAGLTKDGRSLYFSANGKAKPVGSLITIPELAQTLEAIAAKGPDAFYDGATARSLVATVANATPRPGSMTLADIGGYAAIERDPVCGTYRRHRICGMGPPSSGGVAVIQILKQLERFDLSALGAENPVTWHLFVESQRLAYADRELYLADSDFVSVPVEGLVDSEYLATRSVLISPTKIIDDPQPGKPAGASITLVDGNEPDENGTSHFAVVDRNGTMVSYTSTIEGPFGSGLMSGGFYLNNELTDFSRSPEVGGKLVANRVEGGKRPRSSMAPTVVWDPQGRPLLAIGAAGGSTIPIQTARSIIGVIDFNLSAENALGMPYVMAFGDTVIVEEGTWLEDAIPVFTQLGHTRVVAQQAPAKAGAVLRTEAGWISARDPRLGGKLGYLP